MLLYCYSEKEKHLLLPQAIPMSLTERDEVSIAALHLFGIGVVEPAGRVEFVGVGEGGLVVEEGAEVYAHGDLWVRVNIQVYHYWKRRVRAHPWLDGPLLVLHRLLGCEKRAVCEDLSDAQAFLNYGCLGHTLALRRTW